MPTKRLPMAQPVLVHDDGKCADGNVDTVLQSGYCPACKYVPDMQSTAFVFYCPVDNVPLKNALCPKCKNYFETSH